MQQARANDVDVILKIAKEYNDRKINYKKAIAWYYQAALQNNSEAHYRIGEMYRYGLGTSQNYKKAMDWYLKAANSGSTGAMNRISQLYCTGMSVTKSIPTAIEWYTKAADQGDKEALYKLAWIYKTEHGFKDLQKAVDWYQKAANKNYDGAKEKVEELNELGYHSTIERGDYFYFVTTIPLLNLDKI
jgi:TPR repeat protein